MDYDYLLEKTVLRAHKSSIKDGRLRFVYGSYGGYKISLRDNLFQSRIVTNGVRVACFERMEKLTPNGGSEVIVK